MIIEKIANRDVDPINFARPLSQAYWYRKMWSLELPESVRMSLPALQSMNRTLDSEAIEQVCRAVLEKLLQHTDADMKAVKTSVRHTREKKASFMLTHGTCNRVLSGSRARLKKPSELRIVRLEDLNLTARRILRDLDTMLEEQDEPDFLHRPTEYAHRLARQIIENSYTHYIGSSPIPAIAPDGEGGLIAEWKSGQRIVRLVISSNQNRKSYVYSRGQDRSQIDYSASGLVLAQHLCSIFSD